MPEDGRAIAGPAAATASLRRYPYPYRAALTICSDIDGTLTRERFLAIQRFLNTTGDGPMGPGLGLEIGNSFFPHTDDDSFAYYSSRPADRRTIVALIKAGYIDCLHSFGDGIARREVALRALEDFERQDCHLRVWVDHARAPTNFGRDVTPGTGDLPGSPCYHADATLAYGVRAIWRGRTSSILGHDVPFSWRHFAGIIDRTHLLRSAVTAAREVAKTALAYAGMRRFALHRGNRLLATSALADGQAVHEFKRCNSYWHGPGLGHDSAGLAYVLRRPALQALAQRRGCAIIYTHIGVGPADAYLPVETRDALRGLATAYENGSIYVTTTWRLLRYCLSRDHLVWSQEQLADGGTAVVLHHIQDPVFGRLPCDAEAMQGITFYVPDSTRALVRLRDGTQLRTQENAADESGRQSVTVVRTRLEYPLGEDG